MGNNLELDRLQSSLCFDSSFSVGPFTRGFAGWKNLGYLMLTLYLLLHYPTCFITFIISFPVLSTIWWCGTERLRQLSPVHSTSDWIQQQFSIAPRLQICLYLCVLFLFLFSNPESAHYTFFFVILSFFFRYFTSPA